MSQKLTQEALRKRSWDRLMLQTARTWKDVEGAIAKTGIDRIDEEHRQMTLQVLELNKIIERIDAGKFDLSYVALQTNIFDHLVSTATNHFEYEESLIEKYKIPGMDRQTAEHASFLSMLQNYRRDFEAGRLTISLELKFDILDWWVHHINVIDFQTFCVGNWGHEAIAQASGWEDLSEIIRSMGLKGIDDQHQEVTEKMLNFVRWLDTPDELSMGLELLQSMKTAAAEHFDDEETQISAYELSNYDEQVKQHHQFMEMVEAIKTTLTSGELPSSTAVKEDILDWWVNHINGIDADTFQGEDWIPKVIAKAEHWDEISDLILSTDKDDIDGDHQRITELTLRFHQVMQQGHTDSKEQLRLEAKEIFSAIYDAVIDHFKREEALIKDEGFPNLKLQKQQHQKFLAMLESYRDHVDSGRLKVSNKLKTELIAWWANHINLLDYRTFHHIKVESI